MAQTGDLSNLRDVRRFVILSTAALCLALLVPMVANARVVPNKRIGKIALGGNEALLTQRLPAPNTKVRTQSILTGLPMTIWEYNGLEIQFEGGNTVTSISTTRVFERTKKGAGVNTPKRLLRKLHPKLRCGKGKTTLCEFGNKKRAFGKVTTFDVRDGRVFSITVWRVIVRGAPEPA